MSAWQPCGRRLRECIDDVCRSMGECAWPPETPVRLDTDGKGRGAADSVSSEVKAAPLPADRPVRLTFPAREPGARRIMAGGVQVGHMLADHRMRWTAYLWLDAGKPGRGFAGELRGRNLAAAREAARRELESGGPWWR